MTERDWGAEAGPLADELESAAAVIEGRARSLGARVPSTVPQMRAAAEGLRLLAEVIAAIGDPEVLRAWVAEHNSIMLRKAVSRIADAAAGVSAETGEEPT